MDNLIKTFLTDVHSIFLSSNISSTYDHRA